VTARDVPTPIGERTCGARPVREWRFESLAACPICEHVEASTVVQRMVQGLPLEFSKCGRCGAIYQNPRLTRDSLADYFSSDVFINDPEGDLDEFLGYLDYFDWDKSYQRTARLRLERILKFKKPPADLLEIGTATGSFLDSARSFGFRVRGLDLSTKFAEIARKRHSLEIDVNYIEEASLPSSHYDVVCSFGGIACWRDPIRALTNIHRSLKSDGIFVMNHFNVDSLPARILGDRHFEYNHASLIIFSKSTMRQCLDQTGFEVVYSQNERQYASLGRIVGYLKQKLALMTLRALRADSLTIPIIVPGTVFSICRKRLS
jgi:SAM-dependent methyltransferase